MEEGDKNEIVSNLNAVSIFEGVTPEKMAEEQQKDPTLELVYQLVTAGEKPKTSAIAKIKSKAVQIFYSSLTDWLWEGGATLTIY